MTVYKAYGCVNGKPYRLSDFLSELNIVSKDYASSLTTPTRITTSDDKIIVEVEVPGVDKESINIQVDKTDLYIETTAKALMKGESEMTANRSLSLSIMLPHEVQKQNHKASLENGILRIEFTIKESDTQFKVGF